MPPALLSQRLTTTSGALGALGAGLARQPVLALWAVELGCALALQQEVWTLEIWTLSFSWDCHQQRTAICTLLGAQADEAGLVI